MIRKTQLPRTAFKRAELPKEPKRRTRKCSVCKTPFQPRSMTHKACKPECAAAHIAAEKARKDKRERQEGLAKLKRRADYLKEAQAAWNKYVRLRDAGKPCCSCGAMPEQKYGGTMDCSHYRSRGSAPHLKFHLHNAAAACVKCNRFLGGNVAALRAGLIERIGLEKILAVEANNTPRKFDQAYLIRIKKIFAKKAKRLAGKK
jgi:hypothetical protein